MKVKNQSIFQFQVEQETYSVRVTEHSAERANQRGIDRDVIISAIFALKLERLQTAKENNKDLAVIDENNNVAIILGMNKNTINIITVIDKSDIWVKEGTEVCKL